MIVGRPLFLGSVPPPAAAGLVYWMDARDLDGQHNGTLTPGQSLTSVVNKGTRGGTWTPPGTAPKYNLTSGTPSIIFASGDRMVTAAGSSVAQPSMVAAVFYPTSLASSYAICDGLTSGTRYSLNWSSVSTSLYTGGGSTLATSNSGTGEQVARTNLWNVTVVLCNGPTGSWIDQNYAWGAHTGGGVSGSNTPTGLVLGSDFDNSHPMPANSKLAMLAVWTGTIPSTSFEVMAWIDAMFGSGWGRSGTSGKDVLVPPAPFSVTTPNLSVVGGNKICFFGNSITAGVGSNLDRWQRPAETTINSSVVTPCTFVNAGHSGDTVVLLQARVAAEVIALSPQPAIVVIECSVNDTFTSVPIDEFITSVQLLITTLKAGIPGVKLAWLDELGRGELFPDPVGALINQYCAAIRYVCGINGVTHVPVREAQQAFEQTNNTPAPGNFQSPSPGATVLLTIDGVHPTTAVNGQALMSTAFTNKCTFSG